MYLWRAVDDEDKVRDLAVQRRRDKEAALQLLKRLLHNQPIEPPRFATDGLPSYGAAFNQLDLRHCTGRVGCAGTIGRRTLIFRSDDENASSSGSNPKPQRKDCSPSTPIHNTVNMPRRLISDFGLRRPPHGRLRLLISGRVGRLSTWRSKPASTPDDHIASPVYELVGVDLGPHGGVETGLGPQMAAPFEDPRLNGSLQA